MRIFEPQAQSRAMKVMLVFDEACGEREEHHLGDAFWLVESTSNRTLAERAWKASPTDANSAVFKGGSPVATEDVHGKVHNIDLHHPDWAEIVLVSFDEAEPLTSKLEAEGLSVRPIAAGLSITRRVVYHP